MPVRMWRPMTGEKTNGPTGPGDREGGPRRLCRWGEGARKLPPYCLWNRHHDAAGPLRLDAEDLAVLDLSTGVPEELELAFRYAIVREPNETDRLYKNTRQEFTAAANWFFSGHDNKLTLDYSHLTLDDDVLSRNVSDDRVRLQWDISF